MRKAGGNLRPWIGAAIAALTLLSYWQIRGHGFVDFDDPEYVTENRNIRAGLTAKSVIWAFSATRAGNWHPLTWLSHMLDYRIFELNPGGHHTTSLIIHTLNAVLLFLLLSRITGFVWRSGFVAALFAIHPLHVESVAWISERKDVLSALFLILTIWAYSSYAEKPGLRRYLLVVLFFVLGLMAKPMLVTLPFALLLLDYWPLGRTRSVSARSGFRALVVLVREKIPLFAIAAASCAVTLVAQRGGEAVATFQELSIGVRLANAVSAYTWYLYRTLLPVRLAVLYPHPGPTLPVWRVLGSALFMVLATVAVLRCAARRPYLAVGWLWYVVTLIPVIGIIQVGSQSMADRYSYLPLIGIFIMIAWGIPELLRRGGTSREAAVSTPRPFVLQPAGKLITAAALLGILLLSVVTYVQAGYWHNTISLFERAARVTSGNARAYFLLAKAYQETGDRGRSIACYRQAIQAYPDYAEAHNNLGNALALRGDINEAVSHYRRALRIRPNYGRAHGNLAAALYLTTDYEGAWREVRLAKRYGYAPHPSFLRELSKRMRAPD
ncbi:MAG: tetratricopeptide repeat protein [Armatimonadota bacterium]|nr:tetratricopeptide repeat protein [Armatimonadota bacterium]